MNAQVHTYFLLCA